MDILKKLSTHSGVALIENDKEITYPALYRLVQARSAKLLTGSVVLLTFNNSLESIVDYLSCLMGGVAAILIPPSLSEEKVKRYQKSFCVDGQIVNGCVTYESKVTKATIHADLRLLMSTSGSTGSPKMVKLSWQNLDANARSIVQYLDIHTHSRSITSLPLHYSFGLSILNSYLLAGASLVVTDTSITEKSFWKLMEQHKVTSLSGVPFHFETLKRMRFMGMALPHLTVLTQAGGKLPNTVLKEYAEYAEKTQRRFYVMYGQTEASPRIAYLPAEKLAKKVGSIGRSIPDGKLFLVDDQNKRILSPGTEGELVYQGPNVMMGYALNREELTTGQQEDILRTGDLAYFDKDGDFYITGRKSRFIKIHGKRISLADVEEFFQNSGFAVGAVGREDKLAVYIEDPNKSVSSLDDTLDALADSLGVHRSTIQCQTIRQLPYYENGKLNYPLLTKGEAE